jgi:hypothetical protein
MSRNSLREFVVVPRLVLTVVNRREVDGTSLITLPVGV